MRLLFDACVLRPLQSHLRNHEVRRAQELIAAAEEAGFDILVTFDKNWAYQQNLAGRKLAVLVLPTNNWPALRRLMIDICAAVDAMQPGDYCEL